MCKVSVIIPNYNYAGYLHERIASVLNQTYQDFELILLDDASTDNSAEILYGYKDNPHVTHIDINERNTGSPFQQWFKGMALAKGEYIWLAESDDLCNSAFLEKTVRLLDAHPDVAVCFAGSSLIDQDGHVLPRDINKWGRAERKREYGVFGGRDYAEHNLYWKNYVPNASGVLFRKSSFLKADVAQCVRMRYCGDWLFWFKLLLQGNIIELYSVENFFRQHARKASVKSNHNGRGREEDIEIVRQMESEFPGLGKYKRTVRHGMLYNRIRRLSVDEGEKKRLFGLLDNELGGVKPSAGRIAHVNQWLSPLFPFLVSMKRDRLHPKG